MSHERTAIVTFHGYLGLAEVPAFEAQLPSPAGLTRVVLDFTNVPAVDSSIIAALMSFRRKFMLAGGKPLEIVLIANEHVHRVLDMTGTTRAITVVPARPNEGAKTI